MASTTPKRKSEDENKEFKNHPTLFKKAKTQTRVVRLQRKNGRVVQDCDIYIGRRINMGGWKLPQSKWANPFKVKDYGVGKVIPKYREWLMTQKHLLNALPELEGKTLGCWCAPGPCHGDVLVELVNQQKDGQDNEKEQNNENNVKKEEEERLYM